METNDMLIEPYQDIRLHQDLSHPYAGPVFY